MQHRQFIMRVALFGLLGFSAAVGGARFSDLWSAGFPVSPRPWMTVIAAGVMAIGALAALGNKTWGVLVVVLCAAAFAGVWFVGVAHPIFLGFPAAGMVVLGCAAIPVGRRDPTSLALGVASVLLVGGGAVALAGPGVRFLGM